MMNKEEKIEKLVAFLIDYVGESTNPEYIEKHIELYANDIGKSFDFDDSIIKEAVEIYKNLG